MPQPAIHTEAPGVVRIDHGWCGTEGFIASYLVDGGDALALVEAGPDSTADTLLAGIRAAGREPAELTHLFLTHVHLDHAAGAGRLLRTAPRARVYVHGRGAPHLADPSRLLASAGRLYGEQMEALWGTMLPVPRERIVVPADGEPVRVGHRTLVPLDTPGHAAHHLAYLDPEEELVFTGDVAGIRLDGAAHVRPPTPPPEFDAAAWAVSIERLRVLAPRLMLLTHFGAVADTAWHLEDLAARLRDWTDAARAHAAAGGAADALAEALRQSGDASLLESTADAALVRRYAESIPYEMQAAGLLRYARARGGGTAQR